MGSTKLLTIDEKIANRAKINWILSGYQEGHDEENWRKAVLQVDYSRELPKSYAPWSTEDVMMVVATIVLIPFLLPRIIPAWLCWCAAELVNKPKFWWLRIWLLANRYMYGVGL